MPGTPRMLLSDAEYERSLRVARQVIAAPPGRWRFWTALAAAAALGTA